MIRYKIVTVDRGSCALDPYDFPDYYKKYQKNTIVKATDGSLGIFCFDTIENATEFRRGTTLIVKVKSIGKGKRIKNRAITTHSLEFFNFYNRKRNSKCHIIPKGTICYPAVEVLE